MLKVIDAAIWIGVALLILLLWGVLPIWVFLWSVIWLVIGVILIKTERDNGY